MDKVIIEPFQDGQPYPDTVAIQTPDGLIAYTMTTGGEWGAPADTVDRDMALLPPGTYDISVAGVSPDTTIQYTPFENAGTITVSTTRSGQSLPVEKIDVPSDYPGVW